jgi:DNA-binding CsgD family transcriptional regulator
LTARAKGPLPAPPSELIVLESEDENVVILSFALPEGTNSTRLSPAESEVVKLVLEGRSNDEIAATRGTTRRTVANQVSSLLGKLGVRSRLELIARNASLGTPADAGEHLAELVLDDADPARRPTR